MKGYSPFQASSSAVNVAFPPIRHSAAVFSIVASSRTPSVETKLVPAMRLVDVNADLRRARDELCLRAVLGLDLEELGERRGTEEALTAKLVVQGGIFRNRRVLAEA